MAKVDSLGLHLFSLMSNSTILSVSQVSYKLLAFPRGGIEFLENPGMLWV